VTAVQVDKAAGAGEQRLLIYIVGFCEEKREKSSSIDGHFTTVENYNNKL